MAGGPGSPWNGLAQALSGDRALDRGGVRGGLRDRAFLLRILGRPQNERPYVLFPVGYPAPDAQVPDLRRKSLDEVAIWNPRPPVRLSDSAAEAEREGAEHVGSEPAIADA